MSTFAQMVGSLKARATAQVTTLPYYWDRDAKPELPNEPTAFVFFRLEMDLARFISTGGGRGNNIQRTDGELQGFVFLPRDWGLEQEAAYGEHVAAAFRSYRDAHVSCGACSPMPAVPGAQLRPDGIDSEVENYSCVVVAVPIYFDQVG